VTPERIVAQLKAWFPSEVGVASSEIRHDLTLFPEEEPLVARAVPRRKHEFATGRWCAREALAALGVAPVPIVMGSRRGPIWPEGTTGSITHTSHICAAIAGRKESFHGLGIDLVEVSAAEPILAASREIVFNPSEDPTPLAFSSKESVIKAVSAQLDRWMEFTDVVVTLDDSAFEASVKDLPTPVSGWWARFDDLILTAAAIGSL
jgi:4'-phosphopantetheinyl transferase EntD